MLTARRSLDRDLFDHSAVLIGFEGRKLEWQRGAGSAQVCALAVLVHGVVGLEGGIERKSRETLLSIVTIGSV